MPYNVVANKDAIHCLCLSETVTEIIWSITVTVAVTEIDWLTSVTILRKSTVTEIEGTLLHANSSYLAPPITYYPFITTSKQ